MTKTIVGGQTVTDNEAVNIGYSGMEIASVTSSSKDLTFVYIACRLYGDGGFSEICSFEEPTPAQAAKLIALFSKFL